MAADEADRAGLSVAGAVEVVVADAAASDWRGGTTQAARSIESVAAAAMAESSLWTGG
jgi:hypothetical protein